MLLWQEKLRGNWPSIDFSNLSNFEPAFVLLMLGVSEIRDSTVLSEKFSLIVVTFVMRKLLLFAHWCTISYQLFRCGCFCTYDLFSLFFLWQLFFDMDTYIESKPSDDQEFYREVSKFSQLFHVCCCSSIKMMPNLNYWEVFIWNNCWCLWPLSFCLIQRKSMQK